MYKFRNIILGLFIIVSFNSNCKFTRKNSKNNTNIRYEKISITDTLYGREIELSGAEDPIHINNYDSIIIVVNRKSKNNKLINLYSNKSFTHIASTGIKGRGPGELLSPLTISVSNSEESFYIHAGTKMKVFRYPIIKAITNKSFKPIQENNMKLPLEFFYGFFPIDNDKFFTTTDIINKQFIFFNQNSEILNYNGKYKDKDIDKIISNNNVQSKIKYYKGRYAVKPDKTLIAHALIRLNKVFIYNIKGDKIRSIQLEKLNTKEVGFMSLDVSNKYIYVIDSQQKFNSELKYPIANYLYIINWDGKLLKTYYLNTPLYDLSIDLNNDKIYGINNTSTKSLVIYENFIN